MLISALYKLCSCMFLDACGTSLNVVHACMIFLFILNVMLISVLFSIVQTEQMYVFVIHLAYQQIYDIQDVYIPSGADICIVQTTLLYVFVINLV